MSTVEIACCGMFHRIIAVPWTCPTCGKTHLGAAPRPFRYVVEEQVQELRVAIEDLEEQRERLKWAIEQLTQQQTLLMQYLGIQEPGDFESQTP